MNEISLKLYSTGEHRIKIDKKSQEDCWQFANNWIKNNPHKYQDTGQSNSNVIRNQIFFGKVGEVAARIFANINFKNSKLSEVDYIIYSDKDKSWDSDLKIDGVPLHVKSYSSPMWNGRIPRSWIWQFKSSSGRKDDLFSDKENHASDIVICCDVSDCIPSDDLFVDIMLVSTWSELQPYLTYPMFASQKNNKKSIYYQTILDVLNNEEFITI